VTTVRKILHSGTSRRTILAGLAAIPLGFAAGRPAFAQSQTLTIGILDFLELSLKPVFEAYQAARPGTLIEYSMLPSTGAELRQTLLTRRISGTLPDITYLADIFSTQFAEAGITTDMRAFLTSGGPINEGSFAAPFLGQYLMAGGDLQGGIFGLPYGADTVVIFYNKTHFDAAGLPYPDDTWTFEKQAEVMRALTVKDGAVTTRYGAAINVPWHATYVPGIEARGDTLLNDEGLYKLTTPAAIETFTSLWNLVNEGVLASETQLRQQGGTLGAFTSGTASMFQGVRAHVPSVRAAMTDDWDVALVPTINGVRKTGMGSIAQAITPSGQANNPELAYDFLNWFYSEDGGMKVLTATYGVVPPVTELFDSPIWLDLPGPPYDNRVFSESITFGTMNPTQIPASVQSVVDSQLRVAEEAVTLTGADIATSLAEAEAIINEAMALELAQ